MRFWVAAVVSAALLATPAQARWLQAESEHFVIYAEDSERDLKHFGEMLERYHVAMERLTGRSTETPSPSNRVTIFVLNNEREVRKVYGGDERYVAGFYVPRAGMSRAFVPRLRKSNSEPDFSQTVLMHEYAHHFLSSSSRFAMPRWLSEGMAEFFASTKAMRDGGLQVGRPANHRATEFYYATDVPIRHVLDADLYAENRGRGYDSFYGRSWSMVHYLWFSEERKGQLNRYWQDTASGTPSLEAAEAAFGDLDQLDDELEDYIGKRRMLAYTLTPDKLPIGPVRIYGVSEGMDKMLPIIARSQSGVTREEALELLPEAREIAEKFPDDARVLAGLAEAEVDAGNYETAITVADRAIAIDRTVKDAHLQKGLALFRMAGDAEDQEGAYATAIRAFGGLNGLEHDNPLPLIYLYRSYVDRGERPSEHAQLALVRAAELAPFDKDLSMMLGLMYAQLGEIKLARYTLTPVATDPHGGNRADFASKMLLGLFTAKEGQPFRLTDIDEANGNEPAETEAAGS